MAFNANKRTSGATKGPKKRRKLSIKTNKCKNYTEKVDKIKCQQ